MHFKISSPAQFIRVSNFCESAAIRQIPTSELLRSRIAAEIRPSDHSRPGFVSIRRLQHTAQLIPSSHAAILTPLRPCRLLFGSKGITQLPGCASVPSPSLDSIPAHGWAAVGALSDRQPQQQRGGDSDPEFEPALVEDSRGSSAAVTEDMATFPHEPQVSPAFASNSTIYSYLYESRG